VADGRIPALIFGAGPQEKTVAEMLSSSNMVYVRGFIDPNIPIGTEVHGIPVLGADADVKYLVQGRLHMGIIAVGWLDPSAQLRTDLFSQNNENKLMMPPVVHPTAFVDPTAVLGYGVQIHAGAHVGADAVIADGSMISTNAVVSHGSYIGEHTHIAPGAILAGNVTVGAKCLIGMGVTVFAGLSIKSGLTVLNGQDIFTSLG
jgi:sugar O-acyltransferase (sialic acid O-acetyltransferase NeuD family)